MGSRRRAEAEGTMAGGNFRLSTTERVIQGAWRAGPPSETRWERARARAAVRGRREGAAEGEREGGGGPGCAVREGDWEGVGGGRPGSPRDCPLGPPAFSAAPRRGASGTARWGADVSSRQPREPGSHLLQKELSLLFSL